MDCSPSLETHHSAADIMQNAHLKSTWILTWTAVHLWKPIIPLRTSCKMPMLCPHRSHHRLQFNSENLLFHNGRRAKCLFEVNIDHIIDGSSSLETHHSAGCFRNALQSFRIVCNPKAPRIFYGSHAEAIRMVSCITSVSA